MINPIRPGRNGSRRLRRRVEEPLGGQHLLQPFEAGQQLAEADLADLVGAQAQRAPGREEVGLGVQRDPGALFEVGRAQVEHVAVGGDGEAQVGGRVTQREEHRAGARPAADLRDLAVDPDPAQLGDPAADLLAHHPYRPRLLRGALGDAVRLGGAHRTTLRWAPAAAVAVRTAGARHSAGGDRATYDWRVIEEPARKRVLLAKPRGYCAGVDRAVQTVEEALKLYGAPIYVRKQIVHNKHVVATLERRARSSSRRTRRCPRAPPSSSPRTASRPRCTSRPRPAQLQGDRRDLPAGDQGPPRGESGSPPRTTTSCSSATRATKRSSAPPARPPPTSSSSTARTASTR